MDPDNIAREIAKYEALIEAMLREIAKYEALIEAMLREIDEYKALIEHRLEEIAKYKARLRELKFSVFFSREGEIMSYADWAA